ncbi:MAG: hypothetical protein ACK578_08275 [Pirellula sp.]
MLPTVTQPTNRGLTRKIHSDDGRNLNGRVVGDLGVLWFLVLGSWTGDWRLETGDWRMENGEWRLAIGK